MTEEENRRWVLGGVASVIVIGLGLYALAIVDRILPVEVITTQASWYSVAGSSPLTASGQTLQDDGMTCASWDYPFGTVLKVTNLENGKSVQVVVNDRGPAKRLYAKGRRLDLSKGAFACISDLKKGIISVNVQQLPAL